MISNNSTAAISSTENESGYPTIPPFLPHQQYPEFRNRLKTSKEQNVVYDLLRELMRNLGFDKKNASNPDWNPFSEIIKPGDKVLIKPNLVRHIHLTGGNYQTVVTHASLIRCVLDYVALALKGHGEITVGDAPVQSTDFENLVKKNNLNVICEDVSNTWDIPVNLVDFRLWSVQLNEEHNVIGEKDLSGDSKGYRAVDLGKDSFLQQIADSNRKFRITSYDSGDLQKHHNKEKNEYLIPKTVLDANVVINLPKLKTHRKVAITAALKNLVGINGHKDWLPHHRIGSLKEGGDEYREPFSLKQLSTYLIESIDKNRDSILTKPKRFLLRIITRLIKHTAPDPYREGSWYGNDTLWRTVLDLNRLLIYADNQGVMQDIPQRKCLTIVDGIIAGEREGPMEPDPRNVGVLIAGYNPVVVDAVIATMIGFDYRKIPIIAKAFQNSRWPLANFNPQEIKILTKADIWKELKVGKSCDELCFEPPSGWAGYVECEQCGMKIKEANKKYQNDRLLKPDNDWL